MKSPYRLVIATEPAVEVIADSDEIKNWLKQSDVITSDDTLVLTLEASARQKAENYTNRAFITQTWDMIMDCQPRKIDFPFGRLQSVTTVKTIADDETETTETSTIYTVTAGDRGRLFLRSSQTWTSTTRYYDYFKIRFVCGYGDTGASVPEGIKIGILEMITAMYYNRDVSVTDVPAAEGALNPFILYTL